MLNTFLLIVVILFFFYFHVLCIYTTIVDFLSFLFHNNAWSVKKGKYLLCLSNDVTHSFTLKYNVCHSNHASLNKTTSVVFTVKIMFKNKYFFFITMQVKCFCLFFVCVCHYNVNCMLLCCSFFRLWGIVSSK